MSDAQPKEERADVGGRSRLAHLSLRWQLLIGAIVIAVVPVLIAAYLLNSNASDSLEQEAERGMTNQVQALQGTLNQLVNDRASDVLLMTGSDFLYDSTTELANRQEFLSEHGEIWEYPADITVIDPEGTVLVGYEQPSTYPSQFETQYFQRTVDLEEGQAFVGDVGPDPITGQTVINISAPSYAADGDLLGILRIAWPVSEFNAFLDTLSEGENLEVNVYNSNGIVVGSSDVSNLDTAADGSGAAALALEGESGVVRDTFDDFGSGEEEYFVAYGPIQESNRVAVLDWSVTVASPADLVFAPVEDSQGLTAAIVIGVAILAIIIAILLTQILVRPIRRLADVAAEVAAGNFGARADVSGPAEIQTTAVAVNQMLDEITGLVQTREERDAIQREVSRLLVEVSDVARGNLTVEAHPDAIRDETLGSIASSFNYMVRQLRAIVSDVNETTNAVTSASTGIAERSTSLAQVSSANSQRIAETASALDEMVLSIQHVNENARLSSSVATEARQNAEAGAQAMRDTIEALQAMRDQILEAGRTVARLGESSQEIGQTVQIISQIARQTNTLALNASIQAARSGQHGRGFAVVADEVRKLAERAATATRQIETMVKTIQADTDEAVTAMTIGSRQVAEGVDLAGRTGSRLAEIDAVINRLGELIDTMSVAAEEQAATAVELAQSMRVVSTSTAESTESTQDAAESATMLARLAERLRDSVAVFRLGEDDGQTAAPAPTPADGD
ncbi:MAG: methyl-accepting chemotaxis protein [Thermomicrobiales bacterium]